MERRLFLKIAGSAVLAGLIQPFSMGFENTLAWSAPVVLPQISDQGVRDALPYPFPSSPQSFEKINFFDRHYQDDIFLSSKEMSILVSALARFKRVQRTIGHGNFCLAGFDDAYACARAYTRVGAFTPQELVFLEKLFHRPAADYGFMGRKTVTQMTWQVPKGQYVKVRGTGNYLFRGNPEKFYRDILKRVGADAVLTSGIRGVSKQFLLFMDKAAQSDGNLSMASRSLAPPGYSFHATGDFDVGEKGFGIDNFTEKFTKTRVFSQLSSLGYIKFRYSRNNHLGVRYEPWHVEVG